MAGKGLHHTPPHTHSTDPLPFLSTLLVPPHLLPPHVSQIILAVAIKGLRPPLPDDLHPGMCALITACWSEEPRKRPSCREVLGR